jgi:CheY-like chemotaxis protein
LALINERPPDVIALDLHLPDVDGWEVLRRLTATTRTPRIPVGQSCRASVPMHPGDLGTGLLHKIEAPRS